MTTCETIGAARVGVRSVVTITQSDLVTNAANIMLGNRVASLVVVAGDNDDNDDNDDTMVGIISERDILQWISSGSPTTYFQEVQEIMTRKVIFCEADVPLDEAWKLMKENCIRHIPIISNDVAVAMLSVRDLLDCH
jgi:CBS domain-containing protein